MLKTLLSEFVSPLTIWSISDIWPNHSAPVEIMANATVKAWARSGRAWTVAWLGWPGYGYCL